MTIGSAPQKLLEFGYILRSLLPSRMVPPKMPTDVRMVVWKIMTKTTGMRKVAYPEEGLYRLTTLALTGIASSRT